MNEQSAPREPHSDVFHLRPDVVKALRDQPPKTFEELYEKLKIYDAEYALQLLVDAERYSSDIDTKQAFAAGVLHVLNIQLASYEVTQLEAQLGLSSGGDDGEAQPRSDAPGDGQPVG